jgi:hypothetical protein
MSVDFPDSMSLPQLNPVEPPWYGPVCPVVGEGWHREVSPYPDLGWEAVIRRAQNCSGPHRVRGGAERAEVDDV